jgi:hypothetical protein
MSPALTAPHTPMTMTSLAPRSADPNPFETTLKQDEGRSTGTIPLPEQMREVKLLDESAGPVATIFNNVLRYIDGNLLDLLRTSEEIRERNEAKGSKTRDDDAEYEAEDTDSETAEKALGPEANFEFMANSVWTPVAESILSELGGVLFAAGRVAELHQVSRVGPRRSIQIVH